MRALHDQVQHCYRQMELHSTSDLAKAIAAWRCALARFRMFPQFAEDNLDLYEEGQRRLGAIVVECESADSADAMAEAAVFRAQLQARLPA